VRISLLPPVGPRLLLAIALGFAWLGPLDAGAEEPPERPARLHPSPGVLVTVESDDASVRLERVEPGAAPQPRCVAPCRRWLERDALYRIAGDGIRPTQPFRLPAAGSDATVSVRAGSSRRYIAGLGAVTIGGLAVLASGAFLLAGGVGALEVMDDQQRSAVGDARRNGAILLAGGAALTGLGIYFLISSRTRIDVQGAPDAL
jgi:hypothetical protein